MNYYISDLHIDHYNVLKFDKRPFSNVEEMKQTIVKNWNDTVTKEDTVYILGDEHWGTNDAVYEFIKLLNGKKVLILGNHSIRNPSANLKNCFQDIKDYKEITDNGRHVILCHYPILLYKAAYNPDVWMLHGHTHNTIEQYFTEKWTEELVRNSCNTTHSNKGHIINCGCMLPYINYTPRTLDELIQYWNKRYESKKGEVYEQSYF